MNIIKLLSENNAMMVIHYYGINDYGTGFAIRKIIENSDLIINYYKDKVIIYNDTDKLSFIRMNVY